MKLKSPLDASPDKLLKIRNQDPDLRRKGRVLAIMLLGMVAGILVVALFNTAEGNLQYNLVNAAFLFFLLALFVLNRFGFVFLAGLSTVVLTGVGAFFLIDENLTATFITMPISVLVASYLLAPWAGFIVAAVMIVSALILGIQSLSLLVLLIVAVISYLFADSLDRMLAQTRAAEERYALAARATNDGLWDWNLDTDRVYFSPRWKILLGYEEKEIGNSLKEWLDRIHPDDRQGVEDQLKAHLEGKEGSFESEHRMLHKSGEYRWMLNRGVAVRDENGKVVRMAGSQTDINERKEDEKELELRAVELANSNAELEQFAHSVSHDLRAPLRGINGFSQVLVEDYADRLDEEGRDYLRRVVAASDRMGRLIDDMLNLSRLARSELRWQKVDLSALAYDVAGELQDAHPERRIELSIEGGHVAYGDATLLRVVLENLLGNAWKFTKNEPNPRIEFGGYRQGEGGEGFVYYVRDNGAGFDMTYADQLFGDFQRLHSNDEYEGTGIGLATVARIIERHGGDVRAEGEEGRGATFYFTLR